MAVINPDSPALTEVLPKDYGRPAEEQRLGQYDRRHRQHLGLRRGSPLWDVLRRMDE